MSCAIIELDFEVVWMKRIIFHIDVNNAFLSWMAVERLKNGEKVDIRKRYAVIGGDEAARRGIVTAKSDLCKKCGVKTADTIYSARKKCPYLEVYAGDFKVFRKYSDMMYNYLLKYTNIIERYSIDECFLDYTASYRLFGDPVKVAYQIKDDIYRLFGFTVNVGVGNNKLEAKMASDFEKPNRVHTLFDEEIPTKMWILPIDDLFMLGKSSAKALREMGIETIGELACYDVNRLIKRFKSHGKLMWEFANGIDNSEVSYQVRDAKSISCSTVLPYDYRNREECLKVLRQLSMEVGRKLRQKKVYAKNVSIWIKYNNFVKESKQKNLENTIYNDMDIFHTSALLFDSLWDKSIPIRALCVGVGHLSHEHDRQLSLFEDKANKVGSKHDMDNKLQEVIDKIRDKYGNDKIVYADMLEKSEKK